MGKISDSCMHNAALLVLEKLRVAASNYKEQQFVRCSCWVSWLYFEGFTL